MISTCSSWDNFQQLIHVVLPEGMYISRKNSYIKLIQEKQYLLTNQINITLLYIYIRREEKKQTQKLDKGDDR